MSFLQIHDCRPELTIEGMKPGMWPVRPETQNVLIPLSKLTQLLIYGPGQSWVLTDYMYSGLQSTVVSTSYSVRSILNCNDIRLVTFLFITWLYFIHTIAINYS